MTYETYADTAKGDSLGGGGASCVIPPEVARFLETCAQDSQVARRATLAKLLPHLNARLEEEAQGLLDFQKFIQDEDKENAQARTRGRAFNAELRRKEQAALLFNLEFLKFQEIREGLDEATLQRYQKINDEFLPQLEQALTRHRQTGKLSKDHAKPKVAIPPRRNHRREELARRTALIKELTQFCEVVESVVAGTHIVDDETLADLVSRARAYLSDNQNNHKFYEDEIYEREIYELAPPPPPYELVNGEVPPPDPRNYGDSIDYINSKHYQDYQQQQKKRDPRWRKVFQIQRAQIEAQLETREERAARKQKEQEAREQREREQARGQSP